MEFIRKVITMNCSVINKNTNEIIKKQDVMILEDMNFQRVVLNLSNGVDMTKTYWTPIISSAKKMKVVFENSSLKGM